MISSAVAVGPEGGRCAGPAELSGGVAPGAIPQAAATAPTARLQTLASRGHGETRRRNAQTGPLLLSPSQRGQTCLLSGPYYVEEMMRAGEARSYGVERNA